VTAVFELNKNNHLQSQDEKSRKVQRQLNLRGYTIPTNLREVHIQKVKRSIPMEYTFSGCVPCEFSFLWAFV
jgi:hypothetical protein